MQPWSNSGTLLDMSLADFNTRFLSGALACCLSFSISFSLFADDDEETRDALDKVRRDIGKLQKTIRETQNLHDSVQKEVLSLERDLAKLKKELNRVDRKLRRQKSKLSKLYRQRKSLRADLKIQHKHLAGQIRSSYMLGRQEYIKILLNLEESSTVGRTMVYYDYFNRARVNRIKKSSNTLASLDDVEKKIQAQAIVLKQIRQERLAKQNELKKVTQSRAIVVAKLHKELVSKEKDLSSLLENERRLERLITDLDRAIPDILTDPGKRTPFARLKGKLRWPTKGRLKAVYGKRKQGRLKWNGVMIMAREGRDIKAVSHGRVAYADFLRGYGLLLIIDHGDGYMSLYGHNQTIYKDIGEWVETGETIASVGTSGGQKHSGLYFEIRHNGKPTDPVRWCRKS